MMRFLAVLTVWFLVSSAALAQAQRDPTVAPNSANSTSNLGGAGAILGDPGGQGDQGSRSFTIIIRNGIPSLVVGTRSYVRGQKLGSETIDRITETEVWLRTGRVVRKVSQFPGIERHAPLEPAACKPNKKNAPRVASCANEQP